MFLAPVTVRTVLPLTRPRTRKVAPLGLVPLQIRHHATSEAGIRNSTCPAGLATVRRPLWTETNLEEITYTTATEVASIFRPSKLLVDSVDDLDGEIGLKASTKSRAVYEVLRLDREGRNRRTYVKRRDLLRAHGLKPRDLRCIEPLWDKPQSAHSFVIKNSAFLVSLFGVRCLVSEDQLLLFDPKATPAKTFLKVVTPRLRALAGSNRIKSVRNTRNDLDDSCQDTTIATFELEVLESILAVAVSQLEAELHGVSQQAIEVLSAVPAEVNPLDLEQIRKTKQQCVGLESRAETIREMLEEILDDEDELLKLNLSSRPHREDRIKQRERCRLDLERNGLSSHQNTLADLEDEEEEGKEIEEVEDLLEYYMQRAGCVESEARQILEGARDLEESIGVSLSGRKFEVNRLELMLSMGSFAAAIGAMVSGIFGMNLRSNLEMSLAGFYGMTGLIIFGCCYVFFSLLRYTRNRRIV